MGSQLRLGVDPRSRTTRINNFRDAGVESASTPALFSAYAGPGAGWWFQPSPCPLPSRERGSFDGLRMNGKTIAVHQRLSHVPLMSCCSPSLPPISRQLTWDFCCTRIPADISRSTFHSAELTFFTLKQSRIVALQRCYWISIQSAWCVANPVGLTPEAGSSNT